MLRTLLCGALALVFVTGSAMADDTKVGKDLKDVKGMRGSFVTWKEGTLTLKISAKEGDEGKETEIKVPDTVKVYMWSGEDKKEVTLKEAFTDLKPDTKVMVMKDADGKIVSLVIGEAPKKAIEK